MNKNIYRIIILSLGTLVCVNPPKVKHFNHNETFFPLTGAHFGVACRDCHKEGMNRRMPTACASCHPMSMTHSQNLGDCDLCHRTAAFHPAYFNHQRIGINNTGSHIGLQCGQCHRLPVYRGIIWMCSNCHAPSAIDNKVHFSVKDACETCHGQVAFSPSTFREHNSYTTPLIGQHYFLGCSACHNQKYTAWAGVIYRDGTANGFCANCHTRTYRTDVKRHRGIMFDANCRQCHGFSAFKN